MKYFLSDVISLALVVISHLFAQQVLYDFQFSNELSHPLFVIIRDAILGLTLFLLFSVVFKVIKPCRSRVVAITAFIVLVYFGYFFGGVVVMASDSIALFERFLLNSWVVFYFLATLAFVFRQTKK